MNTLILTNPEQWKESVLQTVRKILLICWGREPERVEQFLDPKYHDTWFRVFVSETINYSENYEDLEYIGDAVLKNVFPAMIMKKYGLSNEEMTNVNSFYMSKNDQNQAKLAGTLGLIKHIQVNAPEGFDTSKIAVDVFESFFGALSQIGDDIKMGIGHIACYNLISILFADKDIQKEKYGDPITQVIQRLSKTGIIGEGRGPSGRKKGGVDERETVHNLREIEVSIYLTRDQIDYAKEVYGLKLPSLIGKAVAIAKNLARYQAYEKSLLTLDKYGLTREQANEWRRQRMFACLNQRVVKQAERKAAQAGFEELEFVTPSKTDTADAYVLLLIGREKEGLHRQQILYSKFVTKANVSRVKEDKNQIRETVLREYVA